jgi:hypothetical protein
LTKSQEKVSSKRSFEGWQRVQMSHRKMEGEIRQPASIAAAHANFLQKQGEIV